MKDRKKLLRLEDSTLWQQSQKIAVFVYDLIDSLPEEEKISMGYRLRSLAFDLTSDLAEAAGSVDFRSSEYPLGNARKNLFGLKNSYRFLGVQKVIKIDPDFMLLLDKIVKGVDDELEKTWHTVDTIDKEVEK